MSLALLRLSAYFFAGSIFADYWGHAVIEEEGPAVQSVESLQIEQVSR